MAYILKDSQQADVFLAYYTSGLLAQQAASDLQIVELPENLFVQADYGLTIFKGANEETEELVQYILSPQGQQILAKYGFTSLRTSVPEPDSLIGLVLAISIVFAASKKSLKY